MSQTSGIVGGNHRLPALAPEYPKPKQWASSSSIGLRIFKDDFIYYELGLRGG